MISGASQLRPKFFRFPKWTSSSNRVAINPWASAIFKQHVIPEEPFKRISSSPKRNPSVFWAWYDRCLSSIRNSRSPEISCQVCLWISTNLELSQSPPKPWSASRNHLKDLSYSISDISSLRLKWRAGSELTITPLLWCSWNLYLHDPNHFQDLTILRPSNGIIFDSERLRLSRPVKWPGGWVSVQLGEKFRLK
jgi:hypothetical protein